MENGGGLNRLYLFVKNKSGRGVKPGSEEMNIFCAEVNAL